MQIRVMTNTEEQKRAESREEFVNYKWINVKNFMLGKWQAF
jgi:hypothetical protein